MSNPKDRIGVTKVPLGLIPPAALAHTAIAMHDGASKYGRWNWRGESVAASIYIDACLRHILDWYHGEEEADDSGAHHLGHAIACLAIILDAQGTENLIDDRPAVPQQCSEIFAKLSEKVKRINGLREPAKHVTKNEQDKEPNYGFLFNTDGTVDTFVNGVKKTRDEREITNQHCCAPSIYDNSVAHRPFAEAPAPPEVEVEVLPPKTLIKDSRITRTECILGHEINFIDEKSGYIDNKYLQGTAFTSKVRLYLQGFNTIDEAMAAQYAKEKAEAEACDASSR